jgi:galactitol-specific phosphotransferase system IIB component
MSVSGNPSSIHSSSSSEGTPGCSGEPWKKLPDVLKTVIQTDLLTPEEKSNLEQMIRKENLEVKDAVEKSSNVEEMISKLADLVRSSRPHGEKTLEDIEKFEIAMKKISANKNLKLSVKTILKKLQDLEKKPTDIANRKLRMDNLAVQKYISGVEGALEFMEAVGYRVVELKGKKYLEIEPPQINASRLSRAIALLTDKLAELEAPPKEKAPTPEKKRISCVGGCGFWGDEKTENMCSLCYKKKYDIKTSSPSSSSSSETSAPILCTKGCGFFGAPKWKGMCSRGYSQDSSTRRKEMKRHLRVAMTKIRAVRRFKLGLRPQQKNKSKCWKCPRKVGITGIECRCGYIFCGEHRYASEHDCPYDFKKAHQKKLTKDNIKVTGKKLERIDSEGD